ncbi:hypothetical protein HDU83_008589, partial [Entophlyctis luteolus]
MSAILAKWSRAAANRDIGLVDELLADTIDFYSPVSEKPQQGKQAVRVVLYSAFCLFHDFKSGREWIRTSSNGAVELCQEFSAQLEPESLKGEAGRLNGVFVITCDRHNRITRLDVHARPIGAITRL